MAKIYSEYLDISTGQVVVVEEDDPSVIPTDPKAEARKEMICSPLQGRIALGEEVCNTLDAIAVDPNTPWAMREAIKGATRWERLSPTIDEFGYLLGYDDTQMDDLFTLAMTIKV